MNPFYDVYFDSNNGAPWIVRIWIENGPDLRFAYMTENIARNKLLDLQEQFNSKYFIEAMK